MVVVLCAGLCVPSAEVVLVCVVVVALPSGGVVVVSVLEVCEPVLEVELDVLLDELEVLELDVLELVEVPVLDVLVLELVDVVTVPDPEPAAVVCVEVEVVLELRSGRPVTVRVVEVVDSPRPVPAVPAACAEAGAPGPPSPTTVSPPPVSNEIAARRAQRPVRLIGACPPERGGRAPARPRPLRRERRPRPCSPSDSFQSQRSTRC